MAKRALVVDDERAIVKGIRYSLEQDGMIVDCAYDGEEALTYVKNNAYDIILLDVMLPKIGGFEVCQPGNKWFWGTKLLAGIGEYPITDIGYADNYRVENISKKPCGKAGLQLTAGFKLGKLSSISAMYRIGGHFSKALNFENIDEDSKTQNTAGIDMMAGLMAAFIF